MPDRLAVDVVLLPDAATQAWILAVNRELVATCDSAIRLDPDRCLPHVSLAMGCVAADAIPVLGARFAAILTATPPGPCPIQGVSRHAGGTDRTVSSLTLEATPALQALHEAVMAAAEPWFGDCVEACMFWGEGPIGGSSLDWVRTYRQAAAFAGFRPHVTLGYGTIQPPTVPAVLRPRALALCHLGAHCTCRRLLWSHSIA